MVILSKGSVKGFLLVFSLFWISVSAAQVCISEYSCSAENLEEDQNEHLVETLTKLINWVVEKGGSLNPKLEIRATPIDEDIEDLLLEYHVEQKEHQTNDSADSDDEKPHQRKPIISDDLTEMDPTYEFGIFVREGETIEEGEELLVIPESCMIYSDVKSESFEDDICLLADELAGERFLHEAGKDSEFDPYLEFIEDFVVNEVYLPMSWSPEGQNLLSHIVPPEFHVPYKEYEKCYTDKGEGDVIVHEDFLKYPRHYRESIELALSRTRDNIKLIPVFDLISHSNNPLDINVAATFPLIGEQDNTLSLRATRKIESTEELHLSYGLGVAHQDQWHGVIQFGLGTADIWRDHGIMEDYPQRWYFPAHLIDFAIVEVSDENSNANFGIRWNSNVRPDDDAIFTLGQLYQRLHVLKSEMADWDDPEKQPSYVVGVNPREVKRTYEFLCNYFIAVELLLIENQMRNGGADKLYQLQEERVLIDNLDNLYFQIYQSNTMTFLKETNFTKIEAVRSAYQQIDYYKDPKTNDRCLYLDGVYQQCISYWPHYHELCVHKPAKYVKEGLKRVLWVGGGDSGVLNEFLKYPTLELAVGLELDQQVTRSAFKHFGSQPHYDDPRVQWWYGDASKSLLMLPEDYFGSFDLVIVDLSDTVFSLSVSSELDVIEAISLLLRPGGIFEMNELFMKKVSNVFEYAVHYQFNDVPRILDQAAIFASNDVDFMFRTPTEHTLVDDAILLVEKDSMLSEHQFHRVHDYRHNPNPAFKKLCKKVKDAAGSEQSIDKLQSTAPGIMMIVEAESLTADLSSPSAVQSSIIDAIKGVGLTVVSKKASSLKSPMFVIMMKEGYVVVRLWADEKYCALDVHLWSSFDSHDALKEAIVVKALGGDLVNKSTSSYRIVAGGMFGFSNWKEEAKKHGPQLDNLCAEEKEIIRDQPSPVEVYLEAMEMSLDVLQGTALTAAVLCGPEDKECSTLKLVEIGEKFAKVIPLYDAVVKDGEDARPPTLEMTTAAIEKELPNKAIVDVIIFDFGCTVLANDKLNMLLQGNHTDLQNIFLAATVDSKLDLYKRRALSAMRDEINYEPVYRAQFLFNTTSSSLELSITASGDPLYMEHISEAVAAAQKKPSTSTVVEIRNILGGNWRHPRDPLYENVNVTFSAVKDDYDHTDSTAQWSSQVPVATQTLLQFSNMEDGTPTLLKKKDLVAACKAVFSKRAGASMTFYDGFGADGAVCAGIWETGTAVVSWDGRYGVDLNILSTLEQDELNAFESDIKGKLTNLGGWLRDVQPRGYGRVVNFNDAKKPGVSSLFADE